MTTRQHQQPESYDHHSSAAANAQTAGVVNSSIQDNRKVNTKQQSLIQQINVRQSVAPQVELEQKQLKTINYKSTRQLQNGPTTNNPVIQRRAVADLTALKAGIVTELYAGEVAAGSNDNLLAGKASNVKKLTHLYTPLDMSQENFQNNMLNHAQGNAWRESWYDRVDARVRSGAQQTASDWIFWAQNMQNANELEAVDVTSVELLGEELHDRGLGPAKVNFLIEAHHNPLVAFNRTYVIKPEDRSVEKVILGSSDSVATRLNEQVTKGRQVNTLDMETDANHGTIMEYVTTSLQSIGESILRKVHFWDSSETVTIETVGLAFLTGLYDLHQDNVMSKGSAPALIDADVAVRPTEFSEGPSHQQGFDDDAVGNVQGQIGGDHSGSSQILQYAIDNPVAVTQMIANMIGNHRSRIVPVHTALLATRMSYWVNAMQAGNAANATQILREVAMAVPHGKEGSPGLTKELGLDQGNLWNFNTVVNAIRQDYNSGVIPHFQYQASNGTVYLHGHAIWQGTTLAQSMTNLHNRLIAAQ